MLMFAAAGSAVAAANFGAPSAAELLLHALATSGALIGLIASFGAVSGGHFNPIITLGQWLNGERSARCTVAYVVCQIIGGIAGPAGLSGPCHSLGAGALVLGGERSDRNRRIDDCHIRLRARRAKRDRFICRWRLACRNDHVHAVVLCQPCARAWRTGRKGADRASGCHRVAVRPGPDRRGAYRAVYREGRLWAAGHREPEILLHCPRPPFHRLSIGTGIMTGTFILQPVSGSENYRRRALTLCGGLVAANIAAWLWALAAFGRCC